MFVVEAEFMYIRQARFCESEKDALNTAEKLRKMGAKDITVNGNPCGADHEGKAAEA